MKILIVDHSELIRFRLTRQLWTTPGIGQVIAVADCLQALRLLGHMQPALMVLDPHLPDGDVVHLIPLFKSRDKDLKIVVLTNDAADYNRQRCLQAGADGFFDKSTEFEQLLAQLQPLSASSTPWRSE